MTDYQALIQTQVGQAVLAKFAASARMSQAAMQRELQVNGGLAVYFCQVCRKVVDELKEEAA